MNLQTGSRGRLLCLHQAARRLQIPERTLRYQASRGRIPGAFKQGKLWKFPAAALERRNTEVKDVAKQEGIAEDEAGAGRNGCVGGRSMDGLAGGRSSFQAAGLGKTGTESGSGFPSGERRQQFGFALPVQR
jgi:hypothetical protein